MKTHAIRLKRGDDLKESINRFVEQKKINSGFIISGLGHLKKAALRTADSKTILNLEKDFEIVSLEGTLCQRKNHLHMSISDAEGNTVGGHVKEGCIVGVTAELVIGESDDFQFSREHDPETGYEELKIDKKN